MRFLIVCVSALATLAAGAANAQDLFATSFFSPAEGDTAPGLSGVLRIDGATGVATTFIPEAAGGLAMPTDVVRLDNTIYVSTQGGTIWHYNATTGEPLDSLVDGQPAGVFAALPTAGFGDGVNSLLISRDQDLLLAATAFGSITPYSLADGAQGADRAAGLNFPSGLSELPTGELVVAEGDPFGGPGRLITIDAVGASTTLVEFGADPGINGAGNPTVVLNTGDYSVNGVVDDGDYLVWQAAFGFDGPVDLADGNNDGVNDAADYTIWRDQLGDEAQIVVTDLFNNRLMTFGLDGSDGDVFAITPPELPNPLPPNVLPSNSPSEVLVTEDGTLLVSLLGLTRRPDNRGAILEYDFDGNLLRTIASDLPPISGIDFAPALPGQATPEPGALLLAALGGLTLVSGRRR